MLFLGSPSQAKSDSSKEIFKKTTCQDFIKSEELFRSHTFQDKIKPISPSFKSSQKEWMSIDVLVSFSFRNCKNHLDQDLILFNGEYFLRLQTNDDICDGGNVYGVIYDRDFKKPLVHIYDGEFYCPEDWRKDHQSNYYK